MAAAQKRERYARDLLKKGKGKMPPYIKTFKQSETFLFVIIKDHFDDLRENCGDLEDASGQACYVNGVDKLYNKIIPLMKSMVKRCKDTDKPKRCKEDWEDEIKTYQKDLEKIKRRYR